MKPLNIWLSALRRRQFDFLLLVFFALCGLPADGSPPPSGVAPVNLPAGGFGIDGNLIPNTPAADVGDWLLCPEAGWPGTGGAVLDKAGLPLNATTTFHFIDAYGNVGTDLIFSGGLKWTDNPNTWRWTTGKPSSKTEINNALMHIATDAEGHIWVTISADRLSTSGDSYIDFEFLQNTLTRNSNGTFTSIGSNGGRTTNDVLLSLAFTGGGKVADFFAWMWRPNGSGGFAYADVTASMPPGRVFAALNSNTVAVPYGAFGKTNYAANAFAEAAVDLTALLGNFDQCLSFGFKTIMIKTKASASTTASIEDFLDPIQYSLKIGPSADAGPDQTRCTEGASTDFPLNGVATAGLNPVASASWSLVAGTATIDSLDALATTAHVFSETATFRLTVVQSNGCAATDDVILSVQQPPVCAITGVTSTCVRTTNTFTAPVGMTTYAWSVAGNGFISGVATQQTVKVVAGEVCGAGYTVSLVTRSNVCTVSCASDVLVTDTTLPVLTCPPDRVLNCPANTSTNATGIATATDSCSRVRVTYSDAVTNGCGVSQIIARTWTATDECGNGVSCTQMITVRDITAPTMTCPANRTLDCPADTSAAANGMATATDLCGAANVTFNDLMTTNCGNTFVIARTWTATDLCGNSTSCVQTLTMRDITPPVITCPTNLTLQCPADTTTNATGTATATDACNRVTITYSDSVTNQCGGTSTIQRTWTATDDCGNKSTCLQTITVRDTTPPVITCPPNVTLDCPAITTTNATGVATATDACGSFTMTYLDSATNGCAGTRTIARRWTAMDQCGNSSSCTQMITVRDITPPVITCPPDRTLDCPANTSTNNTGVATAIDACGSVVITRVDTVTTNCGNAYTILRRWTATDTCNNSSSCTQTIVVRDATLPVLTCPPDRVLNCPANTSTNATGVATATDSCSRVRVTYSDAVTNGCGVSQIIARTWTATDDCGNTVSCTQMITVRDITAPTMICPANRTLDCPADTSTATNGMATATDLCGAANVTFNDLMTTNCGNTFVIARTWTATDLCGNSTSCVQTLTMRDITPPVITCPTNLTLECPANTTTNATGVATATDACNRVAITYSDSVTNQCGGTSTIRRTWTATDDCGNKSTCLQTITVRDTTPPVITCPSNRTLDCPADTSTNNTGVATATEACGTATITFTDAVTNACGGTKTIVRTWRAVDQCGNAASCAQTISVRDITPPVITCPSDRTLDCPANTSTNNTGVATATDTCSSVVITRVDTVTTNCGNTYTILRRWTATDSCSNSSSCTQTIVVRDITPPLITCPPNLTLECPANTATNATGVATASDTCGTVTISFSDSAANNCGNTKVISRTWRATDQCGNQSSCVQTITVRDTRPPTITSPANVTLECGASTAPSATGNATAQDTCSAVTVSYSDIVSNACGGTRVISRRWTAVDSCANSTNAVQTITVRDTTAPALTLPSNRVLDCPGDTRTNVTGVAAAVDVCGSVAISYSDVVSNSCGITRTVRRTWTATDQCGNSTNGLQTITVRDTAPTISCPTVRVQCVDHVPAAYTNLAAFRAAGGVANDTCDAALDFALISDSGLVGRCPGTVTRVYRVTDDCGLFAQCTQTITVDDTIAPVLTCPTNRTVECGLSLDPATTGRATATDNCTTNVSITYTDALVPSEYNINFYAADPDLNTGPYGPTYLRLGPASLPRPVARSLDPLRNAVAYAPSGQLDALTSLGGEPMALGQVVPFEAVIELSGSPGPERGKIEFTVDWSTYTTSNDRFGFDTNYMVYCAFVDAADPGCIDPNYNARVDSFSSRLVNTGTIDEQIRGTFQISGLDIGDRVVVEIWMVFDYQMPEHVGGTIAAQLVAAEKALTPPEPITVGSKTISIGNLNKTTSLPPAQTQPPLGPLPPQPPVLPGATVSVIDRTWAATDDCGNRSTCVQRFTLRDTTGPVLIAPDVVLECPADTSTNNTGTATTQDACGSVTVSFTYSDIVSNSCGGTKTVWRTWTATDQHNNTNSLVQTITVRDTIKPTIVCPPNRVLECPADTRTNVTGVATAQDGCGQVTIGYSDAVLSGCGGTKVITRTWTAVDTCGNSASCVQTIAVQDTTAPTLVCHPDRSVSAEETWTFDAPTVTDNCGTVTVRALNTTTNMLGDGACITVCAWEAIDECGNRSTCQQTITAAAPVSPVLEILRSTQGQVILRWPASPTGFQLEACDDVTSLNWVPVSATPVTSNGFNTVEIPSTSAQKFYRLYKPGL